MKQALYAVAQLAQTNLSDAVKSVRNHPLWHEEIHIEEELINLEEAFTTAAAAAESLQDYPQMRAPLVREQRAIIRHSIGLIARMMKGKELPREYTEQDVEFALTRLIRLIVQEAIRVGRKIDDKLLQAIKPYLSFRQRLQLHEWREFSPRLEWQLLKRRFNTVLQLDW